jgi:hypothetical protein
LFRTSLHLFLSVGFLGCAPIVSEAPAPDVSKLTPASRVTSPVEEDPAPPPPESVSDEDVPFEMTDRCSDAQAPICTPSPRAAEQLCQRKSQDLALSMFRGGTPWRRAFMRLNLDAWYTGARHAAPAPLEQGEEVLILVNRTGGTGVQVGVGNYDVYRWNGSCASVMADEVSFDKPRFPKTAPIAWERIEAETQSALLDDRAIQLRKAQVKKSCQNDGTAPDCVTARDALTSLIAKRVRQGGSAR